METLIKPEMVEIHRAPLLKLQAENIVSFLQTERLKLIEYGCFNFLLGVGLDYENAKGNNFFLNKGRDRGRY